MRGNVILSQCAICRIVATPLQVNFSRIVFARTRNQRSKAMLADGMNAAAKINLKNEVTDSRHVRTGSSLRNLHYRAVRFNALAVIYRRV
jgi:hypothetical protein